MALAPRGLPFGHFNARHLCELRHAGAMFPPQRSRERDLLAELRREALRDHVLQALPRFAEDEASLAVLVELPALREGGDPDLLRARVRGDHPRRLRARDVDGHLRIDELAVYPELLVEPEERVLELGEALARVGEVLVHSVLGHGSLLRDEDAREAVLV